MEKIKAHGRFPMVIQCQDPLKISFSKSHYLEFVFVNLWSRPFIIKYKSKFDKFEKKIMSAYFHLEALVSKTCL